MNNSPHSAFSIGCKEKYVEETVNTKFLGLKIDIHRNSNNCICEMMPQ
jgi:hypothetical protein